MNINGKVITLGFEQAMQKMHTLSLIFTKSELKGMRHEYSGEIEI